jgi:hypothetical protein
MGLIAASGSAPVTLMVVMPKFRVGCHHVLQTVWTVDGFSYKPSHRWKVKRAFLGGMQ